MNGEGRIRDIIGLTLTGVDECGNRYILNLNTYNAFVETQGSLDGASSVKVTAELRDVPNINEISFSASEDVLLEDSEDSEELDNFLA